MFRYIFKCNMWSNFISFLFMFDFNYNSNMKNIKDLTDDEGKEILNCVYPHDENDHNSWAIFQNLSFEPKINDDGSQQVTFSMNPIIGIVYKNSHNDTCVLHFNHTKVVLWLYNNGYDIKELLEQNAYLSEMEYDFENFQFDVLWLSKGEKGFSKENEHLWTLEYVKDKCKKLIEKYVYKDYE